MLDDLLGGCGLLVVLIIIGISLFLAMYFGNAFSIPGVIVLLIIGIVGIFKLMQMLGESQQEATENRTARRIAEKRNQELKAQLDQKEQQGWFDSCLVM